jgi:hypothetical protein
MTWRTWRAARSLREERREENPLLPLPFAAENALFDRASVLCPTCKAVNKRSTSGQHTVNT